MDTPSLRQLDIFAQMVAAGSIARCAAMMGVPAEQIAHDLASLEMRLGYRLFEEGTARLTSAGHKTAQAMTLLSQDAPEDWQATVAPEPPNAAPPPQPAPEPVPTELPPAPFIPLATSPTSPPAIDRPAEPPRQTILLAAPAPIFGHFQEALSAFEAANEDIAIALDLRVQSGAEAAAALRKGRADIAYFYALEAPADLASRYGWSEPLNIYVGTEHPLARAQSVSREDLAVTPMLAMERSSATRAIIEEALMRARTRLGPVMLESDNMFTIMAALRDGVGLFPAFGGLARDLGRMDGIRRLALDLPLPAIEIRQAVGPRAAETPAVEALADFLFL